MDFLLKGFVMCDSYSKFKEDLATYQYLCRLLNEKQLDEGWMEHFYSLKQDKRIEWKDYRYQLKA